MSTNQKPDISEYPPRSNIYQNSNDHQMDCLSYRTGILSEKVGRGFQTILTLALCFVCILFVMPQNTYAVEMYAQQVIPAEVSAAEAEISAAEVETENGTKKGEKLIRIAEAEIGTSTKTSKERTKYEKETFGSNGHLWCASFVSWCANKAGVSRKRIPRSMSTLSMAVRARKYYKPWNATTWKNLRRGDVIFFSPRKAKIRYAGGGKAVHHVGIVQRVDRENKLLYTVEGNVSRITKKGKIDLTRRVVRACVYLMKPKTGKILKSETRFFDGEYICGTIAVK